MEFIFETNYDQKGITAMAKALRKTIRKKRSKRSHIFGAIIILCAILLSLPEKGEAFVITVNLVVTWIAVVVMVFTLLFEDRINGYIARRRMLPGMDKSIVTFKEESYLSETAVGKTEFYYNNIHTLVESDDYFVFIFNQSHAQIYDKKGLKEGSLEGFRNFITEKTGKEIQRI